MSTEPDSISEVALRTRSYLRRIAGHAEPITYRALAKALDLTPPNTIHQLALALELLIEEDAAASNPLLAALVVSKVRGGLPAPGFFDHAHRVGRFDGDPSGPAARAFHTSELDAAAAFWSVAAV